MKARTIFTADKALQATTMCPECRRPLFHPKPISEGDSISLYFNCNGPKAKCRTRIIIKKKPKEKTYWIAKSWKGILFIGSLSHLKRQTRAWLPPIVKGARIVKVKLVEV
jgi:hypothetical protein